MGVQAWRMYFVDRSLAVYHNLHLDLPFALAVDRGSDGGVDEVADHVTDERSRHGPGVFCVRVRVL